MKKFKIIAITLILSLFSGHGFSEGLLDIDSPVNHAFSLDLLEESLVLGGGAALYGTEFLLSRSSVLEKPDFDGNLFDINTVNGFDRLFMKPYSKGLDITSDILAGFTMAAPAVLLAFNTSDWAEIGVMYAESLLWAQGLKETLKLFINRSRPFLYFPGFPEKSVLDKDSFDSFPSGHSALSWCSASFLSYTFCQFFPESKWKLPVTILAVSAATTTSVLRVCSGNHFASDVLAGALLGSSCGILIPLMHKTKIQTKGGKMISFAPALNGLCINVKY